MIGSDRIESPPPPAPPPESRGGETDADGGTPSDLPQPATTEALPLPFDKHLPHTDAATTPRPRCGRLPHNPPSLQEGPLGRRGVRRTREVTLVRHAEGLHNVNTASLIAAGWGLVSSLTTLNLSEVSESGRQIMNGTMVACTLHDPGLTDAGISQAKHASKGVGTVPFDAVFVSPMLRTIETALHIFGKMADITLYLHPGCCETRTLLEGSNAGRSRGDIVEILKEKREKMGYLCKVDVETYLPEEPWWVSVTETRGRLQERAEIFQRFLYEQCARRVAVVSHATFLRSLTQDDLLATCEWRSYKLVSDGFLSSKKHTGRGTDNLIH